MKQTFNFFKKKSVALERIELTPLRGKADQPSGAFYLCAMVPKFLGQFSITYKPFLPEEEKKVLNLP